MIKTLTHTYDAIHTYRRQITSLLAISCLALAIIYSVNLYRVISNSVALSDLETENQNLKTSLNDLDQKYLTVSKTITPDALVGHGFDEGEVTAYISRTTLLGRVALSGHEL